MKKQANQTARVYNSAVLEEFLSLSNPEELARTENRMVLAAKIGDALTAKGIGKKQFAEMVGQNPSVITKWLSGGHNFTVDTLTDIQRVLGVRLLALDEKIPSQKVYQVTVVNVVSSEPSKITRPTGQSFSLPVTQIENTLALKEGKSVSPYFA